MHLSPSRSFLKNALAEYPASVIQRKTLLSKQHPDPSRNGSLRQPFQTAGRQPFPQGLSLAAPRPGDLQEELALCFAAADSDVSGGARRARIPCQAAEGTSLSRVRAHPRWHLWDHLATQASLCGQDCMDNLASGVILQPGRLGLAHLASQLKGCTTPVVPLGG